MVLWYVRKFVNYEGIYMNLRQLQYAVLLSQVLNISQAAEMLEISQPALSKQIAGLEKDLGVELFNRSTVPLTLTAAGECFIKNAKEILLREDELYRIMSDFKSGKKGKITIGISPFRAAYFLSDVIIKLQGIFPGLQIVLSEKNSSQLLKDTKEGLIDFSILNLPVDETVFDVIPLNKEPVVLAVPKRLFIEKGITVNTNKKTFPISFLAKFKDVPFIALGKSQELRILFDRLCSVAGLSPNVTTEVVGITTAFNLAKEGIGATILPRRLVENSDIGENLLIFDLKNAACVRQPAIVMRKGQYISKYSREAIDLIIGR